MNYIANKEVICELLLERAEQDRSLVALCSDSRGSASMTRFAEIFPDRFIETGIAEQNLVAIAAGIASCGMKPFAFSPACFLTTRSLEQVKVDVAYSGNNVKLVGISGGTSYGALGATHHAVQDIACLSAFPGMRIYLPSDRFQTAKLVRALIDDPHPAYIRVGRSAVPDVYAEGKIHFTLNRAAILRDGADATLIACGELVKPALDAAQSLAQRGISCRVLDMYCLKPVDREAIIKAAHETKLLVTIEEHSVIGGLGAIVSQVASESCPVRVKSLGLPDSPPITGSQQEILHHYGLDAHGICETVMGLIA